MFKVCLRLFSYRSELCSQTYTYLYIYIYVVECVLLNIARRSLRDTCFVSAHSLRSKTLLGRALQPPVARNQYCGVLRSRLTLAVSTRPSFLCFNSTRPRRWFFAHCARKYFSGMLGGHWPLGGSVRTYSGAT